MQFEKNSSEAQLQRQCDDGLKGLLCPNQVL